MQVLLVGGIFGSPVSFRQRNLQVTTETVLERELPPLGVDVTTASHRDRFDPSRFDVVHIHHLATGCVNILRHAARHPRAKAPKIVFTRHATKNLPIHHRVILELMLRRADALVALTAQEAELLAKQNARAAAKTHIIHNGIDAERFSFVRRVRPNKDEPWRLLYVGQLIELKRVHLAIEALAAVRDQGYEAILSIVSHRPTLEPELRKLAAELKVSEFVRFLPPATQNEIRDHMQNSHVLLLPSRTEASPTVVIEAGLTGLPSLTYRVGGVAALLPDGWPLANIDDHISYRNHLIQLLANYEEVTARVEHDRCRLAQQHSITTMTREHVQLYRRLLAEEE